MKADDSVIALFTLITSMKLFSLLCSNKITTISDGHTKYVLSNKKLNLNNFSTIRVGFNHVMS